MGQARHQQPQLLGFPSALPAGDQAPGRLILAAGRFDHGAAIVGIREGHRVKGSQRRHQ